MRQEEPSVWSRAAYILHPADWLNVPADGQVGICDYSNALKLGYDPETTQTTTVAPIARPNIVILPVARETRNKVFIGSPPWR